MFFRLSHIVALLVTAIPSIGIAGVIFDDSELASSKGAAISASLDCDETPEPDPPVRLNDHRETAGMSSLSVNMTSSSSTAIRGSTILLFKPVPPLESTYGFDGLQFIPDSPAFKIPRVPIV